MQAVKSADNPKTVRAIDRLSEGTRIPKVPIITIPIIADEDEISNPLPGSDDQKCFLSLTIKTLN